MAGPWKHNDHLCYAARHHGFAECLEFARQSVMGFLSGNYPVTHLLYPPQDESEASKPKKRKTKAPAAAEQEVAAEPDIEHEKSGTKAKRKKTKAASAADAAAGASAASELDSCVETQKVQERASVLAETTLPDAGKEQIKKSKKQKAKQVPTALAPDGAEKVSQGKKAKKQKGVKI